MLSRREWIRRAGVAAGYAVCGGMYRPASAVDHPGTEARFWHHSGDAIYCELCPHGCVLPEGKTGKCRNRVHRNGKLIALGYARPCAVHVDPIEKKPFYHLLPGARTYSLGVAGCNLRCMNCQNYSISQRSPDETENVYLPPEKAVEEALRQQCEVIAFTYTEPTVWIEYVLDTAAAARRAGLKTAMVTSGYINPAPFEELAAVLDAVRIDLKSFSDTVYRKLNAGRLQPVLETLRIARKKGLWLEVINLILPKWNDTPEQIGALCGWVRSILGTDTPIHFSRFYPMYQLAHSYPTPVSTLDRAVKIARSSGLSNVYIGNVADRDAVTFCPHCGKPVIRRSGYTVSENMLKKGTCSFCGTSIAGIWRNE